ncbi:hypothetical protein K492DRAFT_203458 [Lichtheimia hyalospora FSU 10163]|nr:hypothetical protein K492DRAFT_203458 [Lichtheimia hyalospora FSU 10163]
MNASTIILDGHPSVFTPTTHTYGTDVDKTQMLPPVPWWTCMVDSTQEFCRIVWALNTNNNTSNIDVIIADEDPRYVRMAHEDKDVSKMMASFSRSQPRRVSSNDRIQLALDAACAGKSLQDQHICLLLMNRNSADMNTYMYRNDEAADPRDIRATILLAAQKAAEIGKLHVDILCLGQHASTTPTSIFNQEIADNITVSIHDIPNHDTALKVSMQHLVQLHYGLEVIQISNIPVNLTDQANNSSSMTTQNIQMLTRLCQRNSATQNTQPAPLPISDPNYLQSNIKEFNYFKQMRKNGNDVGWCTCMHMMVALNSRDISNEQILSSTHQNSVLYLTSRQAAYDPIRSEESTHMLSIEEGRVILHCLDKLLDAQATRAEHDAFEIKEVKLEGADVKPPMDTLKMKEFFRMMVEPISYQNVHQASKVHSYDPLKYNSRWLLVPIKPEPTTTDYAERITRWYSCFRSCMGTDRFPSPPEPGRSIEDIALEMTVGSPLESGIGVLSDLTVELESHLMRLMDILLQDNIREQDIALSAARAIIEYLDNVLTGKRLKLLKRPVLSRKDTQVLARRLLVALYLVGMRFATLSDSHSMASRVCTSIKSMLADKTTGPGKASDHTIKEEENNSESKASFNAVDVAWHQATQYQDMTVRERQDAIVSTGPRGRPFNFRGRGRGGNVRINPRFKFRYPDPSVMVPHLEWTPPTLEEKRAADKKRQERLGAPGMLLSAYWSAEKALKIGSKELSDAYDGKALVLKNNQWKRVQKEADGRMPKKI